MPNREKTHKSVHKVRGRTVRGHIWIDGPEGVFIGWGRVSLLEEINKHGSMTKTAKSMGMAYRHAWDLVDSMNRQSKKSFVEVAAGGKGGGGAHVTEEGKTAIRLFRQFAEDFKVFCIFKARTGKAAFSAIDLRALAIMCIHQNAK